MEPLRNTIIVFLIILIPLIRCGIDYLRNL